MKYYRTIQEAEKAKKALAKEFGCDESIFVIRKVKLADLSVRYILDESELI